MNGPDQSTFAGVRGALRVAAVALRRSFLPAAVALGLADVLFLSFLAPLSAGAIQWMVSRSGRYAVANEELASFALSPVGLLVVFVTVLSWFVGTALARSSAVLALHGGSVRAADGVGSVARALSQAGRILGLAFCKTALIGLMAMPFVAAFGIIAAMVVRGVDPNWIVSVRPARFWAGLAAAVPVAGIGLIFIGRRVLAWSIALPICVLEDRSPWKSLGESRRRMQGRLVAAAVMRVGWYGLCAVVGLFALWIGREVAEIALRREWKSLETTALAAGVTLLVFLSAAAVGSFLAKAGTSAVIYSLWRATQSDILPMANASSKAPMLTRRRAVLVGVAILTIAGAATAYRVLGSLGRDLSIELTAHRGDETQAPENTLAAIRGAIDAGADRVEIDVRLSRDGAVVLMHDLDFRRVAGDSRRVGDLTLEEIRQIDVGTWFGSAFAGESVPTLDAAIEAMRGKAALNIELKPDSNNDEALAAAVVETVRRYRDRGDTVAGGREPFLITSLSAKSIEAVRRLDRSIPVGLIVSVSVGDLKRMDVDLLSVESRVATRSFIARAAAAGKGVHVWTISDPDRFTRLALEGAEGVIAADVRPLRSRRDELQAMDDLERLLLVFRSRLLDW